MEQFLIGAGGGVTTAGIAAWFIVQVLQMRAKRPGPLIDATTANATLSGTLKDLRAENKRLVDRVTHLEEQLADRDTRIDQLGEKLHAMEGELRSMREALSELRDH